MYSMQSREYPREASRYATLALPKTFHRDYVEDKRSVYWDNGLSKSWPCQEPTTFAGTDRLDHLAQSKNLSRYKQVPDRPSAVSDVSHAAQNATPSQRTEALALPKVTHRDYRPPRQPQSIVSQGARHAEPSARTEYLAKPKHEHESALRDGTGWEWTEWQSNVTDGAKRAKASERVEALAAPKQAHRQYQVAQSPYWQPNAEVKYYSATEGLVNLSQPRTHQSIYEENRAVWQVRSGALRAVASERVSELAAPIERKRRSKK